MLNPFVIRKYAAILVSCFIPVMFFFVSLNFYGFWVALALMFVGVLMSVFLSSMLLKTPFSLMLEGKGILCLDMNSTGIITPFVVRVQDEFIEGWVHKARVKDIFDREAVQNMKPPIQLKTEAILGDKKISINISEDEYNKSKFQLYHYPVLLYNSQVKSIMTKDILAGQEKDIFAEHNTIYLRKVLQELGVDIKNFGRYIVDSLRPKMSLFQNPWVVGIMVVVLLVMAIIFIPKIFGAMGIDMGSFGFGGGGGSPPASTGGGGIITPNP